mgnify:CR=1 FL=1
MLEITLRVSLELEIRPLIIQPLVDPHCAWFNRLASLDRASLSSD